VLTTLSPGDFFGEMALIHNAPRAATVSAKTALTTLELDKAAFDRVIHKSTSIAMAMVSQISNRLRENDQLAVDDIRMRASELAEAYQKLAEQDLARREFLSNIAHELRTPLQVASGNLQILQRGILKGEQLATGIDTVARNVQQIVTLVNDLLFLQEMTWSCQPSRKDMNGRIRDRWKYTTCQEHGVSIRFLELKRRQSGAITSRAGAHALVIRNQVQPTAATWCISKNDPGFWSPSRIVALALGEG
jgi:nitrogen-specific signal transduction histidine kinase